jgi:hypothetical protein
MANFILEVFSNNQGVGFDIGCSFQATMDGSSLLGDKAKQHWLQILVNAFHGWAHNHLCQLKYHLLY